MNAEVVAVGSELLLGQICNSNAQFLSKQCAELGINVFYHTAVGDNPRRLTEVLKTASARSDLVIITGGLGPTKDDLTKETVADLLNEPLIIDEPAFSVITRYFQQVKKPMTENNKKQALVCKNSHVFPNENGLAPGMSIMKENTFYMLLPGPPRELKPMFKKYVVPYLINAIPVQNRIESRVLRFFGIGESRLETVIEDLIDEQTNPTIAPLAADGEVTLRLTAKDEDGVGATTLLDELEHKILARTQPYFYGYGEAALAEVVFERLINKNLTVAAAESLTGGLFLSELTGFSGASAIINGGIVCYTDEVKQNELHVPAELLKKHGAVSRECAAAMAKNIRLQMKADIGISFTGNAGPTASEGKPVGFVYIGISDQQGTETVELQLGGTRSFIRMLAVKNGLRQLFIRLDRQL